MIPSFFIVFSFLQASPATQVFESCNPLFVEKSQQRLCQAVDGPSTFPLFRQTGDRTRKPD
jgi:hypothetical protein